MRVYAPGSCGTRTRQKSAGSEGSCDSDGESDALDLDSVSSHDALLPGLQHIGAGGHHSTDITRAASLSFIACLHKLRSAFQAMGEVIEEAEDGSNI